MRAWPFVQDAGASPLFPPHCRDETQARETLLGILHQDPHDWNLDQTRWRLEDLRSVVPWLSVSSPGSLHRLLERVGIAWKRGREHLHSPDPDYPAKIAFLLALVERVIASKGRENLVFLDELTYYRQPSLANAWEAHGPRQPLATRSSHSNTPTRVIGAVDLLTGAVDFWQGAHTRIAPS